MDARADLRVAEIWERTAAAGHRLRDNLRLHLSDRTEGRGLVAFGKWLAQVVAGYFAYHAVPTNGLALSAFRYHVKHLWHQQLCRRSQRARVLWTQMTKLVDEFLPKPLILHPSSLAQRAVRRQPPKVGAECPNWARSDLSGGRSEMPVPCTLRVS